MSFLIIRNSKLKMNQLSPDGRHNERLNKHYSNKDIDPSRTHLNYHLKEPTGSYDATFYAIREKEHLKGNLRLTGEKQSNVACEFVITSDDAFFDRLGQERTRKFFEDAYQYACKKVGGEQYIISAVVHLDEKTPHMHLIYIPVVQKRNAKKQMTTRINCSEFWKGCDSYARLQDEFYSWMTNRGYDLERGKIGSTAEHLTTEEYKLKKVQEQLTAAKEQAAQIEQIANVRTFPLPMGNVSVKTSDFDALITAAKGYAALKNSEQEIKSLKSEVSSLQNENETLKNECRDISAKYEQLDHNFGAFYDSVADEVALKDENEKLRRDMQNIGNQYHGVCQELQQVTETNTQLNEIITEQKEKIHTLTENLTALQKLHKALEEKLDRVMQFIESLHLKEKLDTFLHRKHHAR